MIETSSRAIQLALKHEQRILWAVTLFPLVAVMLIAVLKLMPGLYMFLIREDGPVEWATALVYFIAASFALSLVLHFWRQNEKIYGILYGFLAVGMLLIAMEEISWGQRQLGLDTPQSIENINEKDELNIHNISGFPVHEIFIAVGFYGAFSRLIMAPLLRKSCSNCVDLLMPPYALFLYFFIPLILYTYYEFLYYTELVPLGLQWSEYWTDQHIIHGKDQEPIELLLSFGFLAFTVLNWVRYRVGAPLTLGMKASSSS